MALFLATLGTTMYMGARYHAGFLADFSDDRPPVALLQGAWYSFTILAILGIHELGHYWACRYYRVDASLPYFLPVPLVPTGTFGAFIRIRQRIPTKAMLFDIGAAGPIRRLRGGGPGALRRRCPLAGDAVAPGGYGGGHRTRGPLLFQAAAWLVWGALPDGHTINLHPMGFAAWFGLLMTALNLFPIGNSTADTFPTRRSAPARPASPWAVWPSSSG